MVGCVSDSALLPLQLAEQYRGHAIMLKRLIDWGSIIHTCCPVVAGDTCLQGPQTVYSSTLPSALRCRRYQQVPKLLSGSGLLQKAQVILAAADALWRDIQPVITAGKQQGLCPSDMYSRADVTWATGICLSRSIRLDDKGGVVVLCPFADLFNHSCDSKAFLLWDAQQQAVVLRADRAYKAGEEVSCTREGETGTSHDS